MMEPGMFRSVISPNMSAISGWECVDAAWLETSNLEMVTMSELPVISHRIALPLPSNEPPSGALQVLSHGLEMWKCLAEKLGYGQRDDLGSADYVVRVNGMVKRVKEELLKVDQKDERASKIPKKKRTFEKTGVQKRKASQSGREIRMGSPVQSSDESQNTSDRHSF
jgi:hypothetical protein